MFDLNQTADGFKSWQSRQVGHGNLLCLVCALLNVSMVDLEERLLAIPSKVKGLFSPIWLRTHFIWFESSKLEMIFSGLLGRQYVVSLYCWDPRYLSYYCSQFVGRGLFPHIIISLHQNILSAQLEISFMLKLLTKHLVGDWCYSGLLYLLIPVMWFSNNF